MALNCAKKSGRMRIGVLMGGPSSEREISLKSGKAVYDALLQQGADAVAIDINSSNQKANIKLIKGHNIDCAFISLHGRYGEDGGIQKVLEALKIPYTGSGVKASGLAMDKPRAKRIFAAGGLKVPRDVVMDKKSAKQKRGACLELGFPLVIKPSCHGSSIGMSIIQREGGLDSAVERAFQYDSKIIVEEFIKGRELTVGVLGNSCLPVIEIIPKREFFDFQAKYGAGGTEYVVPALLDKKISRAVQKEALRSHRLLGCFGCSRVDIILDKNNAAYILEINTIPGFTSTSLLPKAARAVNIEFGELCWKLIRLAYEKK